MPSNKDILVFLYKSQLNAVLNTSDMFPVANANKMQTQVIDIGDTFPSTLLVNETIILAFSMKWS
jgi:hypothetical protein